jgi:SHS2 domain-containing protein
MEKVENKNNNRRLHYRLIDHTADLGVEVYGADVNLLFVNAAQAMFDQMVENSGTDITRRISLSIEGRDRPDLMVNWLRELLFLFNGQNLLLEKVQIVKLTPTRLTAELGLGPFDAARHVFKNEIKAVTYHQVEVVPVENGWRARVIFDL